MPTSVLSTANRAFSLPELVMVLVIIATMAAIAVPRYALALNDHRVDFAARRIRADLNLARTRAIATSSAQTVTFSVNPAPSEYQLLGMADPDRPAESYIVHLDQEPYRVSVASADLGGDESIIYNGYGIPDSGGSITVQAGDRERTVEVPSPLDAVPSE